MVICMGEIMVMMNAKAEKLFGYKRDEILGKDASILIPDRYQKELFNVKYIKPLFAPITDYKEFRKELTGKHKKGIEFPIEITVSPIDTEDGTLISTAIRDISERKKREVELLKTQKSLKHALSSKEIFMAQMSPEIRTQ